MNLVALKTNKHNFKSFLSKCVRQTFLCLWLFLFRGSFLQQQEKKIWSNFSLLMHLSLLIASFSSLYVLLMFLI